TTITHVVGRDHAVRAGRHAVLTAVADVLLDHHRPELGALDRARRAGVEAARVLAVLADVAEEQPAEITSGLRLLDELDVAPGAMAEAAGAVVAGPEDRQVIRG